jgi:hypothetical protein
MLYLNLPCSLDEALDLIREFYEAPGIKRDFELRIKPDGEEKFQVCMESIDSENDAESEPLATVDVIKELRSIPLRS